MRPKELPKSKIQLDYINLLSNVLIKSTNGTKQVLGNTVYIDILSTRAPSLLNNYI